jgi:NAD(P)-dependent dehydrogenase (short-subunit alcohol dehydrogenase family)
MGDPARPMEGRVCLVTGATSGIGAAASLALARLGGTVVLVGRDASRTARQVERIRREAGGAEAETLLADLSSQAQVRQLARDFQARFPRLDVLVNNAGGIFMRRQTTVDGLEMTLALNHLAGFLLTNLLLPGLLASPSGRVVNVASSAHHRGRIDFDDLQRERSYDRLDAYAQSKLANVLFTRELARRLAGTRVTANAADPGFVRTNMGANDSWLRARIRNLVKRDLLSPAQGADVVVYLASDPAVTGVSGRYFLRRAEVQSSGVSLDAEVAGRLWQVSEALIGLSG